MRTNKDRILKVLITNLPAIIAIIAMSVALRIALRYNVFLSFLILSVIYVILGIGIEILLEKKNEEVFIDYNNEMGTSKKEGGFIFDKALLEDDSLSKRRISTSPNAAELASRLKKTRLNLDDLFDMEEGQGERIEEIAIEEEETKVKIINDYSLLLERVKPREKEALEEVKQEEIEEETDSLKNRDDLIDDFDDFKIKTSEDMEVASAKIKDEIDKRLSREKKVHVSHKKKLILDDEIFEEDEAIKENDLDKDLFTSIFDMEEKENEVLPSRDELEIEMIEEEAIDKAIANPNIINELYEEPKTKKKKKSIWKRIFR